MNGHQVEQLAASLLHRQNDRGPKGRLSPLRRWQEARYHRALATAPADALLTALTTERKKHDWTAAT